MTLPSSGLISLNQIHVEAGGPSGGLASLNDSDIRGLISKGSGVTMGFNEWHGASNSSFVIDEGSSGSNYGYSTSPAFGSMSGANYWRGAQVYAVNTIYISIKGTVSRYLFVRIQGNRASNWFNSIQVGAYTHYYNQFSRSYSGSTLWSKAISASQMMDGSGNTSGRWT